MQAFPLAIVVALDDEIRIVQAKMDVDARVHVRPALFTVGTLGAKPIIVARSGIGIPAMEAAAAYLLDHYRPAFCLHVGYCGGSDPQDQPGDLLIASAVVDAQSSTRTAADAQRVLAAEEIARARGLRARAAAVVTVGEIVEEPHEKAFVGTQHEAAGIDMESAPFVAACNARGVPWLVVRAVLDPLDAALPDMGDAITEEGATDGFALAEHLLKKPKDLWELPRLQYYANQARQAIATFVEAWIEREGR